MSDNKLGKFLSEVSNWEWADFVKAEHDPKYTTNQSLIFSLIRSCVMQQLPAIKLSLNRLDGKLKTPIRFEYPKIYYLFPNAKPLSIQEVDEPIALLGDPSPATEVVVAEEPEEPELPSLSLRQTLAKMSDYPRELPEKVVYTALEIEKAIHGNVPMPTDSVLVKSVVAAHLLMLAQTRNIDALAEVFDQIDGKLAETIQVLGEDIYIVNYAEFAPPDARLNENGVMQMEAPQAQDIWANKLGKEAAGL